MKKHINSELLLASMNAATGDVLYTFILTYPRFILPEVNTHRMFSRNTASSRAKPAKLVRQQVRRDPFVPLYVGQNKRGMQAGQEFSGLKRRLCLGAWKAARYPALAAHYALEKLGVHKQIVNRVIEPWVWTEQLVSATDLDNFFLLRDHDAAEPHFRELARQMHKQAKYARAHLDCMVPGMRYGIYDITSVQVLEPGQWHLPFVNDYDAIGLLSTKKKISAARCARVSYTTPDTGKWSTVDRDLELFERLAGSSPRHLSPLEHQAMAMGESVYCGNFKGFKQFRKEIFGEDGKN